MFRVWCRCRAKSLEQGVFAVEWADGFHGHCGPLKEKTGTLETSAGATLLTNIADVQDIERCTA